MRTIVRLNDQLMYQAKRHALATDRTSTQLIQDALVVLMAQENNQHSPQKIHLTTFKGDGLHNGVDINSNIHLQDTMDREE